MTTTHDLPGGAPASPVDEGRLLAGRWTVGARYERRGDVHLHRGAGSPAERSVPTPIALGAWRYRGFEPLPRFLLQLGRDFEAWSAVRHAGVLATLDIGREVGETTCFWVVDAPTGGWLADHLAVPGSVDPSRAVTITLAVGDALAAIHAEGLVHGDVRTRSVAYDPPTGRVRIGWGGLFPRLARSGVDLGNGVEDGHAGTAPELAGGAHATSGTDVYGLAALLYEMLHDRPPFAAFRAGSSPGTAQGEPLAALDPELPDDLADLLERGLRRDPELRPSLRAFVDRLSDVAPGFGAEIDFMRTPPPLSERTPPTVQRTIEPSVKRADTDPALTNTPTSAGHRRLPPTPVSLSRSVVPFDDEEMEFLVPQPPAPNRLQQLLVAVVLLLAVAVSAMALLVWSRQVAAPPPPAPAVVALPAPAPPPVVEPAPPSMFTLLTEPPGAEVWDGETKLGVTPIELPFGTDDTAPPRHLELRTDGYATYTLEQPWSAVSVQHTVSLQKERSRPRPAPGLDLREER